MEINVQPGTRLMGSVWFTGGPLGDIVDTPSGRIQIGNDLTFADLDVLDLVIGQLTEARHQVAAERLTIESARRDSTPADRRVA